VFSWVSSSGSYTIPAVEFTYYDTSKNAYKTIKTQPFTLNVEKGDGSTSESSDYTSKDKDIHTIMLGKTHAVIRPLRDKKGITVFAESVSCEQAAAFCEDITSRIKGIFR
jgi:hypothetical protein